ncbi:MAG: hypothetical protein KDD78_14505 [Caldilineaceae bacterium]|nr:hypothetical protein [Caldilineaceae bacterium]
MSAEKMNENTTESAPVVRRRVEADLTEASPEGGAIGHWILASPMLLFMAWFWVDIVNYYSPLPRLVDYALALIVFAGLIVLPLGLAAHYFVTSLPRLFHNAGWTLVPRESVSEAEQYLVRYVYRDRRRAASTWPRLWERAAQGWVYLEITTIFVGAILMIPLFFSASEFGFGR